MYLCQPDDCAFVRMLIGVLGAAPFIHAILLPVPAINVC
jgi:hypothetical protein